MRVIELDQVEGKIRDQLLAAEAGPVLVTEHNRPVLVIRSLWDDDVVDELVAQHPEFQESIRRARGQKAAGQVRTLAELREKYTSEGVPLD